MQSTGKTPTDNFLGGFSSTITLCENIPDESLEGIEQFSHLEIIYYFHLSDPKAVIAFARHPKGNKNRPRVGLFAQATKHGLTESDYARWN